MKQLLLVGFVLGLGIWGVSASRADDRFAQGLGFENEMRWGEAMSVYIDILKDDPTNAQAHYRLGVVQEKVGAIDDALKSYQEALRLNPNHSEARQALEGYYVNQGVALRLDKKSAAAVQAFRQALSINPSSASAHFELGQELDDQGQTETAIKEYQEAIRLEPDMSAAHARLGALYAKQGQHEQAAAEYQEVIRLSPRDPVGYDGLGVAYSELGKRDEAIETLQQAIRYYLTLGQRDSAKPAYELQKKLIAERKASTKASKK